MIATTFLALLAFSPLLAEGRIHSLKIVDDTRSVFSIESFGFLDGGSVDLDIHDVSVKGLEKDASGKTEKAMMGFVVYPAITEASVNEHIDELVSKGICAMEPGRAPRGSLVINLSEPSTWKDRKESAEVTGAGMFNILFTRCKPSGPEASVSFTIDASFVNPSPWGDGPNYLSAGDMPLPIIYGAMTVAFATALFFWVRYLRANSAETTRIHHLMTVLLVVKVGSAHLFCRGGSARSFSFFSFLFFFFPLLCALHPAISLPIYPHPPPSLSPFRPWT
jgi:hypothetical protein